MPFWNNTGAPLIRARVPPKTAWQPNLAQRSPVPETATMWKQSGSQKAKRGPSMTTEYRERFLPPSCYETFVSTTTKRDPYHSLSKTKYLPMTTFRNHSYHGKWLQNPTKAPKTSLLPDVPETSWPPVAPEPSLPPVAPEPPLPSEAPELSLPPEALEPSLLPEPSDPSLSREAPEPSLMLESQEASKPFKGITSYRIDYVAHPMQPMEKPYK